jgi:hypothetical protein
MWKMQVQVGAKSEFSGGTHYVDMGEWKDVVPSPLEGYVLPAYRYDCKEDAQLMLDRLYPDIPAEFKRVVQI